MRALVGAVLALYVGMLVASLIVGVKLCWGGPFELQDAYIHGKQFTPNGHTPFMTDGSEQQRELNLNLNTNVFKYGYMNNKVWSLWDQHQVRWVGWNYQIGARLVSWLDVEYEHFSKHILDKPYPYKEAGRFPVEDSVGIKLYLFRANAPASLF